MWIAEAYSRITRTAMSYHREDDCHAFGSVHIDELRLKNSPLIRGSRLCFLSGAGRSHDLAGRPANGDRHGTGSMVAKRAEPALGLTRQDFGGRDAACGGD